MKKIVFVDDDSDIQHIISLVFEKAGFEVEVFSTGHKLLENEDSSLSLIILDKRLPDMDGLEICRRIKENEKTEKIPVIMLSADPNIKSLAKEAGAEEGIEKPFSLTTLREKVMKYAS